MLGECSEWWLGEGSEMNVCGWAGADDWTRRSQGKIGAVMGGCCIRQIQVMESSAGQVKSNGETDRVMS